MEDREMENFLSKAKFTSAEGWQGTWAQQARRVDQKFAFSSQMQWGPAPLTLVGRVLAHNLLTTG
jgi:hypothetical protein